jgi:hypothetical protein
MNTQHTPGPWMTARTGNVLDGRGCKVCTLEPMPGMNDREKESNARLIASAPDLLAALYASKMALLSCMHANVLVDTAFDQVNAAIAQATGKEGAK